MSQIFNVTANENVCYKSNELEYRITFACACSLFSCFVKDIQMQPFNHM